jgi:hypothetical protein
MHGQVLGCKASDRRISDVDSATAIEFGKGLCSKTVTAHDPLARGEARVSGRTLLPGARIHGNYLRCSERLGEIGRCASQAWVTRCLRRP